MKILLLVALAIIVAVAIPTAAIAASNSTSTTTTKTTTTTHTSTTPKTTDKGSNHYKWCLKQKDVKTRSILCPDVFPKSETTIGLYG